MQNHGVHVIRGARTHQWPPTRLPRPNHRVVSQVPPEVIGQLRMATGRASTSLERSGLSFCFCGVKLRLRTGALRLGLSTRLPYQLRTLVVYERTDLSGSIRRCCLECEAIDGPAPMVQ